MKSGLRIYYDILKNKSTNTIYKESDRRRSRLQLSGFMMACECIDSDDARSIVAEYAEFEKQELM